MSGLRKRDGFRIVRDVRNRLLQLHQFIDLPAPFGGDIRVPAGDGFDPYVIAARAQLSDQQCHAVISRLGGKSEIGHQRILVSSSSIRDAV